ncbi:hypothetical protein GCM10009854_11410 [Saccharopolyspora halophila]|uniref:Uncharacterized protein n=1 Tax=Saccharopolyspora halophila TaxID=405551 RepID=A0ABP5SRA1_9PSEU
MPRAAHAWRVPAGRRRTRSVDTNGVLFSPDRAKREVRAARSGTAVEHDRIARHIAATALLVLGVPDHVAAELKHPSRL